jgi:hypothetical protein
MGVLGAGLRRLLVGADGGSINVFSPLLLLRPLSAIWWYSDIQFEMPIHNGSPWSRSEVSPGGGRCSFEVVHDEVTLTQNL